MKKISANSIHIVQDGEEGSIEGPPGVGDGGEPRPELRGDPLAVSEKKDKTILEAAFTNCHPPPLHFRCSTEDLLMHFSTSLHLFPGEK